jgi:osmoprotectant transport system permease protein
VNFEYLFENRDRVLELTWDHLQLSATALAIALVIAIPLGVLVANVRALSLPVLVLLGVVYTIPSIAFLAFLIPVPGLGLGRRSAVVVLAAYAQLALVRNIAAALRGVDAATLEAAQGVGMTWWQVFWRVRLPLALPVLVAGVRIALVTTISLATVTAFIGAGGLGSLLFDGISRDYPSEILSGAVAITTLALCAEALLRLLERLTPAARAARVPSSRRAQSGELAFEEGQR